MKSNSSRTYYILLACTTLWCLLIIFPVSRAFSPSVFHVTASAIGRIFSTVCHQLDSRSFHLFGQKFAVCSRCFAIYSGFLLGVIMYRFIMLKIPNNLRMMWMIAIVPMIIDVLLDLAGVHTSDFITRSVTGGWFGSVSGILLTPLIIEAVCGIQHLFIHSHGLSYESDIP